MGGSSSREKKEEDAVESEKAVKPRLATPFVYTRRGSMYFDEDGDLAHEFYEEVPSLRRGVKSYMRRILRNLKPQGEVKLQFPCLNVDFPIIIYQDS